MTWSLPVKKDPSSFHFHAFDVLMPPCLQSLSLSCRWPTCLQPAWIDEPIASRNCSRVTLPGQQRLWMLSLLHPRQHLTPHTLSHLRSLLFRTVPFSTRLTASIVSLYHAIRSKVAIIHLRTMERLVFKLL